MITFALVLALVFLLTIGIQAARLLVGGNKPLYTDQGIRSRVFVDPIRGIRAKPDRLEGTRDSATLIEYKHRFSRVYDSDVAQVIASVLAVRESGIQVTQAMVELKNGQRKPIALSEDNDELASRIQKPLANARLVATGQVPAPLPARHKCASCSYRRACPHSLA